MRRHHSLLTSATFDEAIAARSSVSIVAFLADWCAPCRLFRPTLDATAADLPPMVRLLEVDVDAEPGLAARYHVDVLPTLIAFRTGRPIHRITGAQPTAQLIADLAGLADRAQTKG